LIHDAEAHVHKIKKYSGSTFVKKLGRAAPVIPECGCA